MYAPLRRGRTCKRKQVQLDPAEGFICQHLTALSPRAAPPHPSIGFLLLSKRPAGCVSSTSSTSPVTPTRRGDKTPCVSLRSYLSSRPARRCEVLTKPDRRKSLIPALLIILYFFCCFYPESLDFNSPLQMSQLYFPVPAPRKITHKPNKRN